MSKEEGCLRGFMIKTLRGDGQRRDEEREEVMQYSGWESRYTAVVVTQEK